MKPTIFLVATILIIGLVAAHPPSEFLKRANSSPNVMQLSNTEVSVFESPAFAKDGIKSGHYNSSNTTATEANITRSMRDFMDGNWKGSQ